MLRHCVAQQYQETIYNVWILQNEVTEAIRTVDIRYTNNIDSKIECNYLLKGRFF